jgi:hypothetical protein
VARELSGRPSACTPIRRRDLSRREPTLEGTPVVQRFDSECFVGPMSALVSGALLHSRSELQRYLLAWLIPATIFKLSALGETEKSVLPVRAARSLRAGRPRSQ